VVYTCGFDPVRQCFVSHSRSLAMPGDDNEDGC
jgi:hypothetical protein